MIYAEDFIPQHARLWLRLNAPDGRELPANGGYTRAPIILYEADTGMYPLFDVHFPFASEAWAEGQTITSAHYCSTPDVGNTLDIVCPFDVREGKPVLAGQSPCFLVDNYSTNPLNPSDTVDRRPALRPYADVLRGTPLSYTQRFRDLQVRWRNESRAACLAHGIERIYYFATIYALSEERLEIDEQIQPEGGTKPVLTKCTLTLDRRSEAGTRFSIIRNHVPEIDARIADRMAA